MKEEYPSSLPIAQHMDLRKTVSPYVIQLPSKVLDRAREAVHQLYHLSRSAKFRQAIATKDSELLTHPTKNNSVLMAYDFHSGETKDSLIEVNTNAAMYLITDVIHRCHGDTYRLTPPSLDQLKQSFVEEYRLFYGGNGEPRKIVITDEKIEEQNRYIEFLMYKDLFTKWKWEPEIVSFEKLKIDKDRQALLTLGEKKLISSIIDIVTFISIVQSQFIFARLSCKAGVCLVPTHMSILSWPTSTA